MCHFAFLRLVGRSQTIKPPLHVDLVRSAQFGDTNISSTCELLVGNLLKLADHAGIDIQRGIPCLAFGCHQVKKLVTALLVEQFSACGDEDSLEVTSSAYRPLLAQDVEAIQVILCR